MEALPVWDPSPPERKETGLGLAIVRQIIIEKHGGTIAVNSELGQGTEFVIEIPLVTSP